MYLLDSNILIYLLSGNEKVKSFFRAFAQSRLAISMVSRMEVLIGTEKQGLNLMDAEAFLDFFENIVLDKSIVREAVSFNKRYKNNLKFKDLAIAATANRLNMTIITADKDFAKIPGLKIKMVKI